MQASSDDADAVATRLLDMYGAEAAAHGHPLWFRIRADDGREQRHRDPTGAGLLGVRVGKRFDGVAAVGTGRLRPLDRDVELTPSLATGTQGGISMACTVARDGAVGWMMRLPDGSCFPHPPEDGLILDVMRRSLGLPTRPPDRPVAALAACAWLDAIRITGEELGDQRLTWLQALSLHPACCDAGDDATDPFASEDLDEAGVIDGWESLRVLWARTADSRSIVDAALAAWMDAGMFSRWLLDFYHPVEAVIDRARPYLVPAAARRVAHQVRAIVATNRRSGYVA